MPAAAWVWAGAATDTTATVSTRTTPGASCRLVASTDPALTSPTYSAVVVADADGYAKLTATGLAAATRHHYGIEINSVLDPTRGAFYTLPTPGPASFSIGFGSCTYDDPGWDHPVYDRIAERTDLTLFQHLGDFNYSGGLAANAAGIRASYEAALTLPGRATWHRAMAIPFVWDDHELAGDNADRTSPLNVENAAFYRQAVPHHPLPEAAGAIYHAYTIGRVRFIVLDSRYHRDPNTDTDSSTKTMLGATQKAWLKNELLAAKAAGAPLIYIVSPSVWSTNTTPSAIDTWAYFSFERAEIATFIEANAIPRTEILSGDSHALQYHVGRQFAAGQRALPEFVSSGIMAHGPGGNGNTAWTFGPYALTSTSNPSSGSNPENRIGLYTTLDITDDGTDITRRYRGWVVDSEGMEALVYEVMGVGGRNFLTPLRLIRPVYTYDASVGRWVSRPTATEAAGLWKSRPAQYDPPVTS